jgi:hypothetical protein
MPPLLESTHSNSFPKWPFRAGQAQRPTQRRGPSFGGKTEAAAKTESDRVSLALLIQINILISGCVLVELSALN